jgi:HK97 family phage portal protein
VNGLIVKALRYVGIRVSDGLGTLTDPRWWESTGVLGAKTTASVRVSEETALNYSAVWAATRLLCGTGSSLPLPVYKGLADEDRTKERSHPVSRCLNGLANPEMPAMAFRSVMWQWQVNRGNCFAEIVREGDDQEGDLVALWPIAPTRVKIERDELGNLIYEVRMNAGEPSLYLEPWQMFHVPSIITHDGIAGHGVIEHARETVGSGIAMEKYGANWFGQNGGVPRIIIQHQQKWDDTQRKAFREEWMAMQGGPDGSKVAILGGGAEAKPISISAEDSQFLETRQFNIEEIARWYGVPPHLLQHLLRATYNNVENLGLDFVKYSLLPWLKLWEQAIWHKLLREFEREEYFAEHNVDALLRGDAASRGALYHQGINDGWMSPNEARKLENLPPRPGGDRFYIQGAIVPLDENGIPEVPEKPAAVGGPSGSPAADPAEAIQVSGTPLPATVVSSATRLLHRRLNWALNKETSVASRESRRAGGFVGEICEFYTQHATHVADEVGDAVSIIDSAIDTQGFVSTWIENGRSMLVEAAARSPLDPKSSVQCLLESETWKSRPERAIEELKCNPATCG